MRIAYLDCFAGISGDMLLGALVDAGLPLEALRGDLDKLGLAEFQLRARKVHRHGISATKVDVVVAEKGDHRHLADVLEIIDRSGVPDAVKGRAGTIFERLARAEAEVHGTTMDRVHFHEVGAVDAIVDVVGAVVGLERLGVERIYASTLRLGRGLTHSAHGSIPVPAPAVVALCRGLPTERTDIPFELVTPTGAAILTVLATEIGAPVLMRTEQVGYGAGERDPDQVPNVLRIEIGDAEAELQADAPTLIETNIDDMTPEVYGYLVDRLLSEGARDAFLTPIVMKKGRPGVVVSVLADPGEVSHLVEILLGETTTLGVRLTRVNRRTVPRRPGTVETPFGPVVVKVSEFGGRTRVTPEYDDCARIARERDVPILEVYRAVTRAEA